MCASASADLWKAKPLKGQTKRSCWTNESVFHQSWLLRVCTCPVTNEIAVTCVSGYRRGARARKWIGTTSVKRSISPHPSWYYWPGHWIVCMKVDTWCPCGSMCRPLKTEFFSENREKISFEFHRKLWPSQFHTEQLFGLKMTNLFSSNTRLSTPCSCCKGELSKYVASLSRDCVEVSI